MLFHFACSIGLRSGVLACAFPQQNGRSSNQLFLHALFIVFNINYTFALRKVKVFFKIKSMMNNKCTQGIPQYIDMKCMRGFYFDQYIVCRTACTFRNTLSQKGDPSSLKRRPIQPPKGDPSSYQKETQLYTKNTHFVAGSKDPR